MEPLILLAQEATKTATDATAQFWVSIVSSLGVASILAWFLHYQTTVAGPAKDEENREAMKEMHTEHTTAMKELAKEQNDTLRQIVNEMRDDREKDRQARRDDYAAMRAAFECKARING